MKADSRFHFAKDKTNNLNHLVKGFTSSGLSKDDYEKLKTLILSQAALSRNHAFNLLLNMRKQAYIKATDYFKLYSLLKGNKS